jgi:hypothetical protein
VEVIAINKIAGVTILNLLAEINQVVYGNLMLVLVGAMKLIAGLGIL